MKERVLTAIVLLLVVIGALFFDPTGWAVKVLVFLIVLTCGVELGKLTKAASIYGLPAMGFILLGFAKYSSTEWAVNALVGLVCSVGLYFGIEKKSESIKVIFGSLWILSSCIALYALSSTKSPATWPLLMTAAIPIWCGDTAAIFVGKAFGKHKLAPSISPNKTWEGSIGNLLACVGAALVLGAIFHYPMLLMVLLGLNCGILGQAGDLFESWLKRKADVKDSGNILPGHGGLLDRLDSLMATAPLSLLILQSLVVPGTPK